MLIWLLGKSSSGKTFFSKKIVKFLVKKKIITIAITALISKINLGNIEINLLKKLKSTARLWL